MHFELHIATLVCLQGSETELITHQQPWQSGSALCHAINILIFDDYGDNNGITLIGMIAFTECRQQAP